MGVVAYIQHGKNKTEHDVLCRQAAMVGFDTLP